MTNLIDHDAQRRAEQEYGRKEFPLGPAAKEILQQHDTDVLKKRVLNLAINSKAIDKAKIENFIDVLEEKYAGKVRKFTKEAKEAEINHAYQVALLTALAIGSQNLHHDTFMVALGHDLDENTEMTANEIRNLTSSRIYDGIDALSHQTNKQDIYPDPNDKRPYFKDLLKAERKDPDLQILMIKAMDQIAVSNGPVTKDELRPNNHKTRKLWNKMTRKKIGEMNLLHSMLSPQEYPQETKVQKILTGGIDYAQQRLDSSFGNRIMKKFTNLRSKQHQVK
jgi:(p)ppGpp synthase/HD superfamily hydrolase